MVTDSVFFDIWYLVHYEFFALILFLNIILVPDLSYYWVFDTTALSPENSVLMANISLTSS